MVNISLLCFLLFFSPLSFIAPDPPEQDIKAAFIRGDDFWIKFGTKERSITTDSFVRHPRWSSDGEWIAYIRAPKGDKDIGYQGNLYVYNLRMKKSFMITSNVKQNYQWAPQGNKISFLIGKNLYIMDTKAPYIPALMAENIENFSWLPNGEGFLISTRKSEKLHSDVILSTLKLGNGGQKPTVTPFYTITVGENEMVAGTSQFKWSSDGKWISFLLIPTASLSADGNTLCLLSSDGNLFRRMDEMLNYPEWMKWSPSASSTLGFIGGAGREATYNKQLKLMNAPSFQVRSLTPEGYADRDFFWKNKDSLFVSRSVESKTGMLNERPLPSLYEINQATGKQKQVTFPGKNEGDFYPQALRDKLVWIRTNRVTSNVYVSRNNHAAPEIWIKDLTIPSWYYEKWNWEEVFCLYKAGIK